MPRVSVIVPYYQYGQYVNECLDSIEAQTFADWECLVIDDASPDDYALKAVKSRDERFRYLVHVVNAGYGAAKNTGILNARGEFIRPLDADDVLLPDALRLAVEAFEAHPEVSLVHGYAERWYGSDDRRGVNKKTYCHAQGRMWRKSVYWKYGLYYTNLRSMGDKEFIYRLGVHPESGLPTKVEDYKIKKIMALYRKHPEQMHKTRRDDPKRNAKIKAQFKARIKQLKREGITRENTEFPE